MALSDTRIRELKRPAEPYKLRDAKGLYLLVKPTGPHLWRYRYRIAGKENTYALGAYPDRPIPRGETPEQAAERRAGGVFTLEEARDERKRARGLVKQGIHPAQHRKSERLRTAHAHANTFEAVAREWLDANKPRWAPRTYRQRLAILERHLFSKVGGMPMRELTTAHVHPIVMGIAAKAPQMAVIARQCVSAISDLAIATSRAEMDVGHPLRKSIKTAPTTHKRPLRPHEIPAFFEALDKFYGGVATKAAIKLLWYTLARPVEVICARWDEFDLEHAIWTIPAGRMKMRRPHAVPLPTQAVDLLRALRPAMGNPEFLLRSRKTPTKHASPTILVKAFDSMGYSGRFSPHGIRVTGRTILGEQGHDKQVLERQLAHQDKKHIRAYDQGDRLEARRVVMQGWADYLDGLIAGAKVTNIGEAKKRA